MRNRRRVSVGLAIVLGLAAFITVLILWLELQARYKPSALAIPSDDEVAEVRASLREFQGVFPAVPEFTVPADRVPSVLEWLRPAEYIRERWTLEHMDELGEIIISTKAGGELRLRFFWAGKNPAVFTPDGVAQFYGRTQDEHGRGVDGGMRLRSAIEDASKVTSR